LFWAADGLSPVVRGGRAGCCRAAVAPKVASSPRHSCRRPPCGQPGSIPAAGGVVKKAVLLYGAPLRTADEKNSDCHLKPVLKQALQMAGNPKPAGLL